MTHSKPPLIVGLHGRLKSGKDEIAKIIHEQGVDVRRMAFGDAMKVELANACECTPSFINENKDAFRMGLQWWATEFRRNLFGPDYWVKQLRESLTHPLSLPLSKPDMIVITDVRFPAEAEFVRSLGGLLWYVKRPMSFREWLGSKLIPQHCSENRLRIPFDYRIRNSGNRDHLIRQVRSGLVRIGQLKS